MTRVFLTGGSGLIGGALATRLIERGDELIALARSDAGERALSARGARVVRGDTLDEDAMASGMAGCELVYHVAGVNTMCPDRPGGTVPRERARRGGGGARRRTGRGAQGRAHLFGRRHSARPAGTVGSEDSPHRGSYLSVYERSKHEGETGGLRGRRSRRRRARVDQPLLGPGPRPRRAAPGGS